jgi:aspartate 1-decarboxylase
MRRTLLHSKIHRATVTQAELDYPGSITVDPILLEAADIREHERVDVLDITNGSRLTTYVINGEPGCGEICINGAAAKLVDPGDLVIIVCYVELEEKEITDHVPRVIHVNPRNEITEVTTCQQTA